MAVKELNLLEALDMVNEGNALVVDVLVPEHYQQRHIPGAVNACVYEVVFLDAMHALAPDKTVPILLYGAGPASLDSRWAAEKLTRDGYDSLSFFPGGLEAWRAEGYPLQGTSAESVEPPHPVLNLQPREHVLVPEESELRWTGRNHNSTHHGTIPLKNGGLDAVNMVGEVVLDMAGLSNSDLDGDEMQPVLEAHLCSDDFFFTSLFPEAIFRISAMQPVPDSPASLPNYRIMGQLLMRGVGKDVFVSVQLRNLDDGRLVMQGNLDLDRTEWGVLYGSARFFQHLGYHLVYDLVSIEFRLVLA